MLHLLYIMAFTVLALIAVANLIRNLIMFSFDRDGGRSGLGGNYPMNSQDANQGGYGYLSANRQITPHPELLDNTGKFIKEPLLVMRSINVEDARQQLDALYESSPGNKSEKSEEA